MNIQKIDELNGKIRQVEELLFEIDAGIPSVTPDLESAIASKQVIMSLLKQLNVVKGDFKQFREGKSVETTPSSPLGFILGNLGKIPPPNPPPEDIE